MREPRFNIVEVYVFAIVDNKIEYLVLKPNREKAAHSLKWQIVHGKVKSNETYSSAAVRELYEETGLKPKKLFTFVEVDSYFDIKENCITISPVFAAQTNRDAIIRLSSEHDDYKWVRYESMKKIMTKRHNKFAQNISKQTLSEGLLLIEVRV